tara:strand:+ start:38104 stop:38262 length:159 start_codon:yes stop_codon:yes gene_type:complete
MASLDPLINAELNLGAAEDFDGINLSLKSAFPEISSNFDNVAATISTGMFNG